MFSKIRLRKKDERDGAVSDQQESSENNSTIEIDGSEDEIRSVVFLADGRHVVSGGLEGSIRWWQVEDGKEVGEPRNAGSRVFNLAVSPDGQRVMSGMYNGQVATWNATSHAKVSYFQAVTDNNRQVWAVDMSADGTRIATGSTDNSVRVWSFPTGEQLLGPLKHVHYLAAVKFSPDVRFIATATWRRESVRIYNSNDGHLLADFPIQVNSACNRSLAWATGSEQLFVLSCDGNIHRLDVFTKKTLAKWRIHSTKRPTCIALACNDTVIIVSAYSSLSFWDATTHQQIGAVIDHSHTISSMIISTNYDIAAAGSKAITLRNLCDVLPSPYRDNVRLEKEIRCLRVEKSDLEDTVQSLRVQNAHQKVDLANFKKTVQQLRKQLEEKETLQESSDRKINHLDEAVQELGRALDTSQHEVNQLNKTTRSLRADLDTQQASSADRERVIEELRDTLRIHEKKYECERLYVQGHVYGAAQCLLKITSAMTENLKQNTSIVDWLKEFTDKCLSELQTIGDEAFNAKKHDEALSVYSTMLLLSPSPPEGVVTGWARIVLSRCSTSEALDAADKFKLPKSHVYHAICEVLEGDNRVMEAIECFQNMKGELSQETSSLDERSPWELDFQRRHIKKLEKGGDEAKDAQDYDAAIRSYSSALSLDPENIEDIVVKCCKARVGYLEDELSKVTLAIERNPLFYRGYKRKHAVLHSMGRYKEAFDAFEVMMSSIEKSPDPQIRDLRKGYLDPTPQIRKAVERTIHDIPRALIDTTTGRLYDKTQQAAAFEQVPIFNQLRSSMTTHNLLDSARIEREVEKFYEYVMFSHRWQPPEPSFQMIENALIYGLPTSPMIDKLINFCKLVQSHSFRWAWSDTCCVNQSDKGVQQESVVAMFQWYCRAALTIVHLVGVFSETQEPGSLWRSIWNTRGWTYQEYVASKVIQFYTEDWKPYLGLEIFNHKESPIILEEMEQATKFATQALATLQPGLTMVREKLYLASKRETTRREDTAYCLFGIFNAALPVIYGEGNQAIGRLLEHILTRSDNVTILAWTGNAGSIHSYLPSDLTVYDQVVPPHVPQLIEPAEMDRMVVELQSLLPDSSLINQLYERLHDHPPLSVVSGRLRLPGLVFPLTDLTLLSEPESDSDVYVYRATSPFLGDVRIETQEDSLKTQRLVLVHPWINPLIDEDFEADPLFDLPVRALRFVVRLRQPFGALLLALQGRVHYRRVATDSFIKVQIQQETSLEELMDCIRTVDIQ